MVGYNFLNSLCPSPPPPSPPFSNAYRLFVIINFFMLNSINLGILKVVFSCILQKESIFYQYNFILLLKNLFKKTYWGHLLYANVIRFFATGNIKKCRKLMEIVNIEEENLHIYWTTSVISIIFLGSIWIMIILQVIKGLHHLLEKYIFKKTSWERFKLTPNLFRFK